MRSCTSLLCRVAAAVSLLGIAGAAQGQVYSNTQPISIPHLGSGNPYPSTIHVQNGPTTIYGVNVTLHQITHSYCSDLLVLLVAPDGASVKLFESEENSSDFTSNTISFSSDSTTAFPLVPANGTYAPTGGPSTLPGAPGDAGEETFDSMLGDDANGHWSLYIYDAVSGDFGSVAGGWSIEFTERPHPFVGFTYQGRLDGAQPGDQVDMRFTLWDSIFNNDPSHRLSDRVYASATVASDNTVTVPVEWDVALPSDRLTYVEIEVSVNDGGMVALSPRQPLTPTPLANKAIWADVAGFAQNAGSAGQASFANSADIASRLGPYRAEDFAIKAFDNTFTGNQIIGTGPLLAFGAIDDGSGSPENADLIGFQRVNVLNNYSTLHLIIGDEPMAGTDTFAIGTQGSSGNFTSLFSFVANGQAIKPGGGAWSAPSDRRLKHNIQPLTGSLDRLLGLHGVTFEYNDPKRAGACEGVMIGFVAQDVEPIFPRWVSTDAEGYKAITITGFEALTVEALRELRAEKDAQIAEKDAQIADLREQVQDLYERLERLETQSK